MHEWLALERKREPFWVRDVEQEYTWLHGPLELKLRLDRIDELGDGRLALIDYKSGNGNIDPKPDWMRARPVGLQLPFYAAVLRSEEHTSELQSLMRISYAVFCLKKKTKTSRILKSDQQPITIQH